MRYKQVILVRQDLKLPKGKLSAQVAHASLECALKSDKKLMEKWREQGSKKIILKVEDEKELFKYMSMLENEGIKVALIKDAGHTVVEPGTITCLGAGPDLEDKIDKITGKLKMV
ncbi:MAG: peptidyl-tRNA hydrolase Pth2 [Nanoarchaeota archaeon]